MELVCCRTAYRSFCAAFINNHKQDAWSFIVVLASLYSNFAAEQTGDVQIQYSGERMETIVHGRNWDRSFHCRAVYVADSASFPAGTIPHTARICEIILRRNSCRIRNSVR